VGEFGVCLGGDRLHRTGALKFIANLFNGIMMEPGRRIDGITQLKANFGGMERARRYGENRA
jgi:hypothetical protein